MKSLCAEFDFDARCINVSQKCSQCGRRLDVGFICEKETRGEALAEFGFESRNLGRAQSHAAARDLFKAIEIGLIAGTRDDEAAI